MDKMLQDRRVTEGHAEAVLFARPWVCTTFGTKAEIDAFNEQTKKWETIAVVQGIADVDGEDVAALIVRIVNGVRDVGVQL